MENIYYGVYTFRKVPKNQRGVSMFFVFRFKRGPRADKEESV
jgi:hypothetical protein